MQRSRTRLAAAAASALLILLPSGAVAAQSGGHDRGEAPPVDVRTSQAPAPVDGATRDARDALADALGAEAIVKPDRLTGGLHTVTKLDGYLTASSAADATNVALDYVAAHLDAFGLTEADLATLRLVRRYTSVNDITYLQWAQQRDGIPVVDAELRAAVDAEGRLVNVGGGAIDLAGKSVPPATISASAALQAALQGTGKSLAAPRATRRGGRRRATEFAGGHAARLVLFPSSKAGLRLAWRVDAKAFSTERYDAIVDARTGALVRRDELTHDATALAHDNYRGAPVGGTAVQRDITPYLDTPGRLSGPFARAYSDVDGDDVADAGEEVAPSSGSDWSHPFTPVASPAGNCGTAGCAWDPNVANSWMGNRAAATTQAFWLVNVFRDHVAAPPIGFNAASGGFEGDDPVIVETLDTAALNGGLSQNINNANFQTPKDGESPRMQMYLFRPTVGHPYKAVHGGDLADVVYHEYAHGLTGRLVREGADGLSGLRAPQSEAMGEGWSDYYALDFMEAGGVLDDTDAPDELEVGIGLAAQRHVSRSQGVDCPVAESACPGTSGGGAGGYTYGDFGRINASGVESHSDGEIWAQTIWDLRKEIGVAGARLLVTEALRLSPANPSFLDMRNAILQADHVKQAGSDKAEIWKVFARRGMGVYASAVDGFDTRPVEDYTEPPAAGAGRGKVTGLVADADSVLPAGGLQVGFGGHDTPGYAARLSATTAGNGRFEIDGVPSGTYPHLIVTGPGYERHVERSVVVAAPVTDVFLKARRDWARTDAGAVIVKSTAPNYATCGPARAFDGRHHTTWAAPAGRSVTLRLPKTLDVTSFSVDPDASCLEAGGEAKTVRVETSQDGESFTEAVTHSFAATDAGELQTVRPNGETGRDAEFVRVTLLAPQKDDAPLVGLSSFQVHASTDPPPVAELEITPSVVQPEDEVTFDASASTDTFPGVIERYEWDLDGDGQYEVDTRTSPTTTRSYKAAGTYDVRVRVTDNNRERSVAKGVLLVEEEITISDLGDLGGGSALAGSINATGQITGDSLLDAAEPTESHAFRWDGEMHDLGTFTHRSVGLDINDSGVVAGWGRDGGNTQFDSVPALFVPGSAAPQALPGGKGNAVAINNSGHAVGWVWNDGQTRQRATRWVAGSYASIGTFDGPQDDDSDDSEALDVNELGVTVGRSEGDAIAGEHAFIHDGSSMRDLGTLGGSLSFAYAINDRNQVTGASRIAPGSATWRAFVWENGVMTNLGSLGGEYIEPRDINEQGTIVGGGQLLTGQYHAFVVREGILYDLNRLVDRDSGWELRMANGINDRNEITGWGIKEGQERAFVLDLDGCDVCVDEATAEHRDIETGDWQPVGNRGTVDGNEVRFTAKIENAGTSAAIANVKFVDSRTDAELPDTRQVVSLDPGETDEIAATWDTDGLAWTEGGAPASDRFVRVKLTIGGQELHRRNLAVKVRPRPIVAAHGLLSDASTWAAQVGFARAAHPDWDAYAVGDGKAGTGSLAFNTGSYGTALEQGNTVLENAEVLEDYVQAVREHTDAKYVDLVGHSMGGLISRQYIAALMPDVEGDAPLVRHLVMLGTPNLGSQCASILPLAVTYELRPDVVAEFNSRVTDRKGVPFSLSAGESFPRTCLDPTPGDSVVALPSALWNLEDTEVRDLLHTAMTGDAATFADFVKPRLARTGAMPAAAAREQRRSQRSDTPPAPPATHLLVSEEVVARSGGSEVDVPVRGDGSALGVVVAASPDTVVELLDPAGGVVAEASATPELMRQLRVDAPARGTWKVRLTASQSPRAGAVAAWLEGSDASMQVDVSEPTPSNSVSVKAMPRSNGQPLLGARVTAVLSNGSDDRLVRLLDDGTRGDGAAGDGVYAGRVVRLRKGLWVVSALAITEDLQIAGTDQVRVAGEVALPPVSNGRVAYTFEPEGSNVRHIATVNPDGTGTAVVTAGQPDGGWHPRWSPDGSQIAYDSEGLAREDLKTRGAFLMDADGTDALGLTFTGSRAEWGNEGGRLAIEPLVACPRFDAQEFLACNIGIATMRADGTLVRDVLRGVGVGDTSVFPGAERFAFEGDLELDPNTPNDQEDGIFLVDGDGSRLQQLTNNTTSEFSLTDQAPDVSPDGAKIVMMRQQAKPSLDEDIAIVAVASGEVTMVEGASSPDWYEREPVWSPDGTRILFDRQTRGGGSTRVRRLTSVSAAGGDVEDHVELEVNGVRAEADWQPVYTSALPEPPTCADARVTVTAGRSTPVPLTCTDPNNEAITLAVTEAPQQGELGEIDQAAGRVTYTPVAGYLGTDTLRFKGTANGDESTTATLTITVAQAPAPPPPPDPDSIPEDLKPAPPVSEGPPIGGGAAVGGGGGRGSGNDDDDGWDNGPVIRIPNPNCTVNPVTGSCIVPVGCAPGGDITGCTGGFRQAGRGTAASFRAASKRSSALVKPGTLKIARGKTGRVRITLSRAGRKQLARKGKLTVRLAFTLRDGTRQRTFVRTLRVTPHR